MMNTTKGFSLTSLFLVAFVFQASMHAVLGQQEKEGAEYDTCEPGKYRSNSCDDGGSDSTPYLCLAQFAQPGEGFCFGEGLCCCESRDGYFQGVCKEHDICCDGTCCDEQTSFCCGGSCCDSETEVCCDGECVGEASNGTRILVPVLMNVSLAIVAYCMLCSNSADEQTRAGRFGILMLFTILWGVIQMIVARSAWDCSQGLKIAFIIGAAQAGLGFLLVFCKIIQAKVAGESILAAFTLERLILAVVDQQGNVQGILVADEKKLQVAREHMARNNRQSA